MSRWGCAWMAAVALPLVLQVTAILLPENGDMLSEQVIPLLMRHPVLWGASLAVYAVFASWLGWHWWFQYRNDRKESADGVDEGR